MKNRICLLIILLVAFSFNLKAQEDVLYNNSVKEYISVNGSDMVKDFSEAITKLTPYAIQQADGVVASRINANAYEQKYLKTQCISDVAAIFVPYFYQQDVTQEDLNEIIAVCKSPAYVQAGEHINAVNMDAKMEEILSGKLIPAATQLFAGEEPKDFLPSAPRSYVSKFDEYYQLSGMNDVLAPYFDIMMTGSEYKNIDPTVLAKYKSYILRNMENLMVDIFYGQVTAEDIDAYKSFCNCKAYPKIMAAVKTVFSNAQGFGMAILSKYSVWISKEYKRTNATRKTTGSRKR